MKTDAGFHEWVLNDLFDGIRGITSRAMFGGYGFYISGKIFAIIAAGRLYFKANEASIPDFKKYGCKPFHYSSKDRKAITMGYWELPEDIMKTETNSFVGSNERPHPHLKRPRNVNDPCYSSS